MVHEKHDSNAEDGAHQGHPLVVILEGWPPSWAVGDVSMEHGEVDQTIGNHKEITERDGNSILFKELTST